MHEVSLVRDLIKEILEKAHKARAKKVASVFISIGESSGVTESSINYFFEHFSAGTILEGSILQFEKVIAICRCRCGWFGNVDRIPQVCPQCFSKDPGVEPCRDVSVRDIVIERS